MDKVQKIAALERIRTTATELGHDELAKEATKVIRAIASDKPEVVVQTGMFKEQPTIPDGWSFDDVNGGQNDPKFTGDLWGFRLRPGEPIVYQRGHVLFVRQGDLYDERDRGYFERISSVPGQTILVVFGARGKREGYVVFSEGVERSLVIAGADEIADWIKSWLRRAQESPMDDHDRAREGL